MRSAYVAATALLLACRGLASDVLVLEANPSGGSGGRAGEEGGGAGAMNDAGQAGVTADSVPDTDCRQVAVSEPFQYLYCRTPRTWDDALDRCEGRGGTLAKLENEGLEVLFYYELELNTWIGLSRPPGLKDFAWSDGTPLGAYANWEPAEPSGDGRCVQLIANIARAGAGHWNDLGCTAAEAYLCQVPTQL